MEQEPTQSQLKKYAKRLIDEAEIIDIEMKPAYDYIQVHDEVLRQVCGWGILIKGIFPPAAMRPRTSDEADLSD